MSGNELQRIEVFSEVVARRRTEASAAEVLGISTRQARRLIKAYREDGGATVIHKHRGKPSNNKTLDGVREYAVELVRRNYCDFGPSLAAEMLLSKHQLKISRETLRKWIEIICANSSQAKGRVERVNRTLQDRLVKELRLANVSDIDAGNDYLPAFMLRFNDQFAVTALRAEDLHRPVTLPANKLTDILCHREQRYLTSQLTLTYDRKRIILDRTPLQKSWEASTSTCITFQMTVWRYVRKACYSPTSVFSKDQRVNHTAIVENKRLGHALALHQGATRYALRGRR